MNQFRVYLKSELGKLSDSGDASSFLSSVSHDRIKHCGLPIDVDDLVKMLASQERVDVFVDSLVDEALRSLTEVCDVEWRKNDVFKKLDASSTWKEQRVSIDLVDVQQAEPRLAYIFKRNNFQLNRIVGDDELWEHKPYSDQNSERLVSFPVHLGVLEAGRWKLFDGIHRAIHLARQGEKEITIFFYER